MPKVYSGQANIVTLPVANRSTGAPITTGTVNFYLIANEGANAGKWFRGSDSSWQSAAAIAGQATHKHDGHWQLSIASAAWTAGISYTLYPMESGNLHVPIDNTLNCKRKSDKLLSAWLMGLARDKSGSPGTQEILDPDDGATPIAEVTMSTSTPYRTVTLL